LLHQPEQANDCRTRQIESLQSWIAHEIPIEGNQRAKVYQEVAELCDQIGQTEQAACYRRSAEESRTGYSFLYDARQRVRCAGGMNVCVAADVVPILEQAMKSGFGESFQDEVNACALMTTAYAALQQAQKADGYRLQQLAALEAWIAKGIPTESNSRANAYRQAAEICEKMGQMERARTFRQLEEESRDGFSLLSESLSTLKACGKQIGKEVGTRILNRLTKAAGQIPQSFPERHAEIYRATGQILDAWGDTAQAIEYYEYALQKNPKIGVKRRLDTLRRHFNSDVHQKWVDEALYSGPACPASPSDCDGAL
jgi:cell fate (sporulation/competence/biofilm development) regulator YmcA (YheA/YmcA/DUF963 family)